MLIINNLYREFVHFLFYWKKHGLMAVSYVS